MPEELVGKPHFTSSIYTRRVGSLEPHKAYGKLVRAQKPRYERFVETRNRLLDKCSDTYAAYKAGKPVPKIQRERLLNGLDSLVKRANSVTNQERHFVPFVKLMTPEEIRSWNARMHFMKAVPTDVEMAKRLIEACK